MTTFYTVTLPFLLFALASNAFVIRAKNGTSLRSEELQQLLITGLESMRTETENSKTAAAQVYEKILTKISEFYDEMSDEIFSDLNRKRAAFHDFREEESIDDIANCLELVGQLGRSAINAVTTINECAVLHSETAEEYFDDFGQTVAAKMERLNASGIAAHKCLDLDNNELIELCMQDAWNINSHRDALHPLAMTKLQTLLDTLDLNLISCSFKQHEAYFSSSSIFLEEAQKCVQKRNSQDSPIKV